MSAAARQLNAPILTVLDPHERSRVDAAGEGLYQTIHRESLADALTELKRRPVSAVVLSVVRCSRDDSRRTAAVVREFPTVPTVALLGNEPTTAQSLLQLGNCGVTRIVDVRHPAGWTQLRSMIGGEATHEMDRVALAMLHEEIGMADPDVWRFFELLFQTKNRANTIRQLCVRMGVLPSTMMSRFFRAKLPAPKRYMAWARLLRAARLFEDPGHSIADVANALEYSSPQSFSRHIRTLLGITAGEFRRRYTGDALLERFRDELVRPHRDALRQLRPLLIKPGMRTPR